MKTRKELAPILKGSLKTPLKTGNIQIGELIITAPEDKLQLIEEALEDPISRELILSKRFEIEKYEQALINWPEEFSRIQVKKVSDCFELTTPSLATIKKYKGEFKALACICVFLEEVYSFFNVTNTLSDIQLQMSAQLILDEFYFLTIADIRLCFYNAYKNKYGKLYNRLDGSIILDWLGKYTEERAQEAQKISEKNSSEDKSSSMNKETALKFKQLFEAVKDIGPKKKEIIYYPTYEAFIKSVTLEEALEIEAALEDQYNIFDVKGGGYSKDVFIAWYKNKILFRINKREALPSILEGIKSGKV